MWVRGSAGGATRGLGKSAPGREKIMHGEGRRGERRERRREAPDAPEIPLLTQHVRERCREFMRAPSLLPPGSVAVQCTTRQQ